MLLSKDSPMPLSLPLLSSKHTYVTSVATPSILSSCLLSFFQNKNYHRHSLSALIPTFHLEDEMMLQSFQSCLQLCPKLRGGSPPSHQCSGTGKKKKKKKKKQSSGKQQSSSSADSYVSLASSSRPNSGSLTSSSGTLASLSRSSAGSRCKSPTPKPAPPVEKKKHDRGPLKVSINDTAELIEDVRHCDEEYGDGDGEEEPFSIDSATSQVREEREKRALADDENDIVQKE